MQFFLGSAAASAAVRRALAPNIRGVAIPKSPINFERSCEPRGARLTAIEVGGSLFVRIVPA
jgi:hypothetical protein